MEISREEARNMVYEDHEDWVKIEEIPIKQSRWSVLYEGIFQHLPTGKFYQTSWRVGATEMQDESPFEYDDPELTEVRQVEKLVKVWEPC